jgi:1-phosphofructokinase
VTGHVTVFAPAPQLTITVEATADGEEIHLHPGGQGVWQARMISSLDAPVVVCTTVGGEVGRVLRPLIETEGIEVRVVEGDTANGAYVHDRRGGKRVVIAETPGAPLSRHELDELYSIALAEGMQSEVSVLGGPADPRIAPPDAYRRLAGDLRRNGRRVVADLSGDHLTAVLEGGVTFLKVSHEELLRDGRAEGDDPEQLVHAMRDLVEQGADSVLVSRADEPALALLDGTVYEVVMPKLEAAEPRGAGDSMTAGVAAVLARGGDLATAVRTGAAAGALNVTRHGLGTGRADAISQMVEHIELRPLDVPERGRAEAA